MNVVIAKEPEFSQIPESYEKLGDDSVKKLLRLSIGKGHAFNPMQLAFICELGSYKSGNFEEILLLLEAFLENLSKEDINIALQLEYHLSMKVLKKFPDSASCDKYYRIFDKFYKRTVRPSQKIANPDAQGILFFVFAPVYLAHTKPLFHLLRSNDSLNNITIASLTSNDSFTELCEKQNIGFVELQGQTFLQKLTQLENFANKHRSTVWQCTPQFLSYFSARQPDVIWWSHRFNPPISGIKKYITSLPSDAPSMKINGNIWYNFKPSHGLQNKYKNPINWNSRKGKIGAFCREELIDDDKYWSTLSTILNLNKTATFQYCGRKPIHQKWIEKFQINPDQVIFKGWLTNPEEEILKVALILDTYKIRHGVLGQEAMSAGIPILFPKLSKNFGGIEDLYKSVPNKKGLLNPVITSSFENEFDASKKVAQLAFDMEQNRSLAEEQKRIIEKIPQGDKFKKFLELVNS